MGHARDPVSELFDAGARRLLARAYASPGTWVGTRLADPGPRHRAFLASRGINPDGPDPVNALPGSGVKAYSRWARGFVRALYFQHRWFSGNPGGGFRSTRRTVARDASALEVQVGRHLPGGPQAGTVLVPGRAIRVRVRRGGQQAMNAVKRLPDSRRIYADDGTPAARWADPALRDY